MSILAMKSIQQAFVYLSQIKISGGDVERLYWAKTELKNAFEELRKELSDGEQENQSTSASE